MNNTEEQEVGEKRHYFVDEAGDPTIFGRRGKVVAGQEGCSTFFVVGLLEVAKPAGLGRALESLRQTLLGDPYFHGVPSMQPGGKKTAIAFHAKDDLPEVRREVFSLLKSHEMRFFAVLRDKRRVAELIRERNLLQQQYKYHPNHLYDRCISRLFKERLHQHDAYRIVFARRGASDRSAALRQALEQARDSFRRSWGVQAASPIEVIASTPRLDPCLQAADYFLWALQRLYERQEERYLQLLWPQVSLVHDVDDVSEKDYGRYYNQRRPLTLAEIQQRLPGI